MAMSAVLGVTLGFAIEEGGKLAPSRVKLAEAMKASDEASDRLTGTLKELIASNCTWDK